MTVAPPPAPAPAPLAAGPGASATQSDLHRGALLVLAAALIWSFGGAIARFLSVTDPWAIIFWRSLFAALFLVGFMLVRDGVRGTITLFARMGLAGLGVGLCFATASISFVVALGYTTVANILLFQAGAPLIAALVTYILFKERIGAATWAAIAAVIAGIAIMVSDSLSGSVSPVGDGLALLLTIAFSLATVITRRRAGVRMTPAVCFGTLVAIGVGAALAGDLAVTPRDAGLLVLFGALNLGLGLACFVTGARLIPSAVAALISTMEPVAGPVWVWLVHAEVPSERTLIGGTVVVGALILHTLWQLVSRRRASPQLAP